ncbi:hypothetical protein NB661_00205 [Vibrio parahaemolyticus]|uniref:hypothetical protein n=1 Tax=Vibrio parahaemolyticus TaxID=670 RepID=UPI00215C1ADB|nr:hypothetical protein [Vibrio parahaemolyticus]MCR9330149.1 hypothetical protein [Vibrio parahaemolyticus]
MSKVRLSKNQKDALFVLALLEVNGKSGSIPLAKVRTMIATSRSDDLDPSNFRKGIHILGKRGVLEVGRLSDLSLCVQLSRSGRHVAAGIYQERTGQQMDLKQTDDEQMTIFDNYEGRNHDI